MSKAFQRYAVYWTPEPGSEFAKFGADWLSASNAQFGLPPNLAARAARSPARYGLHATLKAPFRLRAGASEAELQKALDEFCGMRRAARGGCLKLSRFQGFLALVLASDKAEIDWLAAQCVTKFDSFRAPLDDTDRARRNSGDWGRREAVFFEEFGYPYVLSGFQFHITIGGPLNGEEMGQVEAALAPHLASFTAHLLKIESLSLSGEPQGGGAFELISRHPLKR
jgi:hypothetical protein